MVTIVTVNALAFLALAVMLCIAWWSERQRDIILTHESLSSTHHDNHCLGSCSNERRILLIRA